MTMIHVRRRDFNGPWPVINGQPQAVPRGSNFDASPELIDVLTRSGVPFSYVESRGGYDGTYTIDTSYGPSVQVSVNGTSVRLATGVPIPVNESYIEALLRSGVFIRRNRVSLGRVATSYIETVKRVGGSTSGNYVSNSPASGNTTAINRTYGQTIGFERNGDSVRIIVHNADISAPANIEGLSVYATNNDTNSVPTGPEVVCTFGGVAPSPGNPIVVPAGTPGESGALADRLFSYVRSDWMPITMLGRIDGGSGFLLHVRIFSSGGLPRVLLPQTFTSSYSTGWLAASGGRSFSTWYGTGDFTHTPAWTGATTTARQFVAPTLAVQVRGSSPILNAGQGFDSQAQGFHAAPGPWTDPTGIEYYGAIAAAQNARTSGPLFSAANLGSDGMQGSSGHINLRRWIDALELKAVMMQVWSGNSGYGNIERDKTLALETMAYAKARGCVPILMSAYPRGDSTTSGQNAEQNLLNLNAWIATQNADSINVYSALGNGAVPQRLQSAYNSGDFIHRSMAGQDVEGLVARDKLQEIARLQMGG